jgi:hypothetical protein
MTLSGNITDAIMLLPWAALWALGGLWLAKWAFRLRANESMLVGLALGWLLQTWLANILVRILPLPLAAWGSAGLVFALGAVALGRARGWKALLQIDISLAQCIALATIFGIYFAINRGLAIFDDYAHLPTVSIMATGDIPPHFSLAPQVPYAYHYFLLLFSAQLIRVGNITPWVALDLGRALSLALAILLAAVWTQRLTRSVLGGFLGGVMMAFGSGARWLLLLLPPVLVNQLSPAVHLLGSGFGSGATLKDALLNAWAVEGAGPLPFPFAFANGIYTPGVITALGVNGVTAFVVILMLLLTCNRWQNRLAAVFSAILISIWGLLGEAELVGLAAGWGLVTVIYALRQKTLRLPRLLWTWLAVIAAGGLMGMLEGGAWTEVLHGWLVRLTGGQVPPSYQTIGFTLAWPPAIVSSHLGVLSLLDPRQLVVALFELGPVILALPLLVIWGIKALRCQRWYEAATAATALVMALMVFVQFTGSTGVRNTPRLYVFMPLLAVFAAPLCWVWLARRSNLVKALVAGLGLVSVLGGVVMLGIELFAIQRPVYSYFLTPLDAQMARLDWNQVEAGAWVFDSNPSRATTLLGRPTNSSYTWYQYKPEWQTLQQSYDPRQLRAAGYRYLYLDQQDWDHLTPPVQKELAGGCPQIVNEAEDSQGNFRRLYDLERCSGSQ